MLKFTFLALFCLSFMACKKTKINLTADELTGQWQRQADDKPLYAGLLIDVADLAATVSYNGERGVFTAGSKKWRNISAIRDSVFYYEELGSDGKYYDGQFSVTIRNNQWFIFAYIYSIDQAQGKNQTWIRQ
jgi:hypothetical protein